MNEKALAKKERSTGLAAKEETQAGIMTHVAGVTGMAVIDGVDQPFRYQFPRLGKIRNGVKKESQGGREYPVEVPYFVLAPELMTDEKFMNRLAEFNPDPTKPTKIPVWLPFNSAESNFKRSCDFWNTSGILNCRTYDFLTCTRLERKTGEYVTDVCPREECPNYQKKNCHWIHRLIVILPDAKGSGVWQIDTPSPNNWGTLQTEIAALWIQTRGYIAGIDLLLTKEPRAFLSKAIDSKTKQPKKDENGNVMLVNRDHYMLHVRHDMTPRELRDVAQTAVSIDPHAVQGIDESYDDMTATVIDPEMDDTSDIETGDVPIDDAEITDDMTNIEALADLCRERLNELFPNNETRQYTRIRAHFKDNETDLLTRSAEQLGEFVEALNAVGA